MPLARDGAVDVGELVYDGPNVMLGYAETPADLALGRVVGSLRTGDVARRTADGLYEVIGRQRFAKVFGLRIDLDQVERVYADEGVVACCADGDDRLVLAVSTQAAPVDPDRVAAIAKEHFGLPRGAVELCAVPEVPRLPNGKPDYRGIVALAAHLPSPPASPDPSAGADVAGLRALYGAVLNRRRRRRRHVRDPRGRLAVLRGDVAAAGGGPRAPPGRLARHADRELARVAARPRRGGQPHRRSRTGPSDRAGRGRPAAVGRTGRLRSLEANVALRALAIVMIVGSHANLFVLLGGAHVLLGVAGFNFGRFHLTTAPRRDRVRHLRTSVARVAVPSAVWIGLVAAFTPGYSWTNPLLLNGVLGPRAWTEPAWHYWFIEALVYTLLALTLVMALPLVDRAERRWPFWLPMMLAGLGLLTRYEVVTVMGGDVIHRANVVFWLFALGWATVKATAPWQRVLVSASVLVTVPGFFDDPARDALVAAGLLALVWVRALRVPAWAARAAGVLASASLYIYLAHWQIYPHLEDRFPLLATVLALLGGIVLWQVAERATDRLAPYLGRARGLLRLRAGAVRRAARRRTPGPIEPVPNRVTG